MLKVSIRNKITNQITNEAQFQIQAEVDAWISECESVQAFGLPERPELNELGEETGAILPAEYTIEIQDISSQLEEEKNVSKYLARIQFGQRLMAELAARNSVALSQGALTTQEILQYKAELGPVKDFLLEGSVGFALQALSQAQNLPIDLKNEFITKMQNYLNNEI